MSDFADGITPPRYPCRRASRKCGVPSEHCSRKVAQACTDINRPATRWSLDEGRWMPNHGADVKPIEARRDAQERNPFIMFKSFVDSSLTSLITRRRKKAIVEDTFLDEDSQETKWTGWASDIRLKLPCRPRSEAVSTAIDALTRANWLLQLHQEADSDLIERLFEDDEDEDAIVSSSRDPWLAVGGAFYFLPEVGDRLPSTGSLFRPSSPPGSPRWLSIDWFKRSPYAPDQVANLDIYLFKDTPSPPPQMWRAAFEELMLLSLGNEIPCLGRHWAKDIPFNVPGIDWVLSLQYRGILPPMLPSLYSPRQTGKIETNFIGQLMRHDYQDFSDFVDEIWKSGR